PSTKTVAVTSEPPARTCAAQCRATPDNKSRLSSRSRWYASGSGPHAIRLDSDRVSDRRIARPDAPARVASIAGAICAARTVVSRGLQLPGREGLHRPRRPRQSAHLELLPRHRDDRGRAVGALDRQRDDGVLRAAQRLDGGGGTEIDDGAAV